MQQSEGKPWDGLIGAVQEFTSSTVNAVKKAMPWDGVDTTPTSTVPVAPAKAPVKDRFEQVFSKLIHAESKGAHTDATGALTTSGAGAQGITQLMAKTAQKPGYGVEPVKDKSEKEYLRFGRDYLKAMLKEFGGDYRKAVAAYNAGPGSIKKAVEKGGERWEDHLPKPSETKPYMTKILGN